MISLAAANTRALAYGVRAAMAQAGCSSTSARPYNAFNSLRTLWWIIPSKDFPAYRHGKYALRPERGPGKGVFCGLHVEKGFGEAVRPLAGSAKERRCIMTDDWIWHDIVGDAASGKLGEALGRLAEASGLTPLVQVVGDLYQGGDFDPYSVERERDTVTFQWSDGAVTIDPASTRTPTGLLSPLRHTASLGEALGAAAGLDKCEWLWLDAYVGLPFALDPAGDDGGAWPPRRLWQDVLAPLKPWFR